MVLKEALAILGQDGRAENHPPEGNAVKGTTGQAEGSRESQGQKLFLGRKIL